MSERINVLTVPIHDPLARNKYPSPGKPGDGSGFTGDIRNAPETNETSSVRGSKLLSERSEWHEAS